MNPIDAMAEELSLHGVRRDVAVRLAVFVFNAGVNAGLSLAWPDPPRAANAEGQIRRKQGRQGAQQFTPFSVIAGGRA